MKIGERCQVKIPKEIRDQFGLTLDILVECNTCFSSGELSSAAGAKAQFSFNPLRPD